MTRDPSLTRRADVAAPAMFDMTRLTMARVIATKPEHYSVDVVTMRGAIMRDVQVVSMNAGSRNGHTYIPSVTNPDASKELGNPFDNGRNMVIAGPSADRAADARTTYAILAFLGGNLHNPVCLGFVYPNESEMLFKEAGLDLDRHESDIYTMRSADGAYEIHFPDGSYIRVGDGTAAKTLVNLDTEKPWAPKTSDAAKSVFLHHKSGTEFTIEPSGKVVIVEVDDKTEDITGDSDLTVGGDKTEDVTGTSDETVGDDKTETYNGKHTEKNLGPGPIAVERQVGSIPFPADELETINGNATHFITGLLSITADAIAIVVSGAGTSTVSGTGTIQATLGELDIATSTGLRLGSLTASERAILGDLFMALYNAHAHGGSGPPNVLMTATQLASQAKVA